MILLQSVQAEVGGDCTDLSDGKASICDLRACAIRAH